MLDGLGRAVGGGILILGMLLLSACGADAPAAPIPPTRSPDAAPPASTSTPGPSNDAVAGWFAPTGQVATLASGLDAPWSVVPLTDGGALISQRDDGAVRELTADGALRTAGVVPGVVSGGESGLHGLALLDEDGEGGRWLYAYHGAADDNRVVRMPLLGVAGELALGAPEAILTGVARGATHNGGRIGFGPDGMLYVATGDAGQRGLAQDPASLNGKILRLTPTGEAAPGNPFGTPVWSLGHRNVQGLAWTADGTLWASEFGQNTWDELNVIRPGANYGWPDVEGTAGDTRFIDPVAQWTPSEASPSGVAAVGDTLFIANLRGERVWSVNTAAGSVAGEPTAALVDEQGRLRDAVAAPDGSLWILTGNTDGRGAPREGDDVLLRVALGPTPD